jgi:hypothetical protein
MVAPEDPDLLCEIIDFHEQGHRTCCPEGSNLWR